MTRFRKPFVGLYTPLPGNLQTQTAVSGPNRKAATDTVTLKATKQYTCSIAVIAAESFSRINFGNSWRWELQVIVAVILSPSPKQSSKFLVS